MSSTFQIKNKNFQISNHMYTSVCSLFLFFYLPERKQLLLRKFDFSCVLTLLRQQQCPLAILSQFTASSPVAKIFTNSVSIYSIITWWQNIYQFQPKQDDTAEFSLQRNWSHNLLDSNFQLFGWNSEWFSNFEFVHPI